VLNCPVNKRLIDMFAITLNRRTIYLTIQSSLDFEEAVHKLLKLNLKPGEVRVVKGSFELLMKLCERVLIVFYIKKIKVPFCESLNFEWNNLSK
jgi:hypothetical protein